MLHVPAWEGEGARAIVHLFCILMSFRVRSVWWELLCVNENCKNAVSIFLAWSHVIVTWTIASLKRWGFTRKCTVYASVPILSWELSSDSGRRRILCLVVMLEDLAIRYSWKKAYWISSRSIQPPLHAMQRLSLKSVTFMRGWCWNGKGCIRSTSRESRSSWHRTLHHEWDFVQWLRRNRLCNILWTDKESTFTRVGMFNIHNAHYWTKKNKLARPDQMVQIQHRFSVNVWAGLLGNRRRLQYQHDGAPCAHLTGIYEDRWIGRGGPIAWPAHSPNLTLLNFHVWSVWVCEGLVLRSRWPYYHQCLIVSYELVKQYAVTVTL